MLLLPLTYKNPCHDWLTRVCCHTLTKPDYLTPLQNSTVRPPVPIKLWYQSTVVCAWFESELCCLFIRGCSGCTHSVCHTASCFCVAVGVHTVSLTLLLVCSGCTTSWRRSRRRSGSCSRTRTRIPDSSCWTRNICGKISFLVVCDPICAEFRFPLDCREGNDEPNSGGVKALPHEVQSLLLKAAHSGIRTIPIGLLWNPTRSIYTF